MGVCFTGYNATNWNTQYFMTNDGPMYYRSSNSNGYRKWGKLVLNSDLKVRTGTIITNEVPHQKSTDISQLTLEAGTYILSGEITFSESFEKQCNYVIRTDNDYIVCRAPAVNGGGQTPCGIRTLSSKTTIYLEVYQESGVTKTVSTNRLKAVRLY